MKKTNYFYITDDREIVETDTKVRPQNVSIITKLFRSFNEAYDYRHIFYDFCKANGDPIGHLNGADDSIKKWRW